MSSSLTFSLAINGRDHRSPLFPSRRLLLPSLVRRSPSSSSRARRVVARIRKGTKHEYPWPRQVDPNLKSGHLAFLSTFKPLAEKPKPVTLSFEKPLIDLEKKINEVRRMADETGLDFSDQINSLEKKYQQALKDLYTHLSPIQRIQISRHPNRPTFLDHILNMTDKWVELHGNRAGYDDPAIVTGLGSINGKTYMFIGHQKGRNTKENIKRNFGMPTPHGYRKALRLMRYANHHGFPIITLIDTPGAFADLKSEELGQGEAIAFNLREMFSLKVPIVSVVIGEGGSGGALAIGCANKLLMLENAVFYVASPEACAAILWKSSQAAPKAAEKLKITARELVKFKVADGIIPEPLGGAHKDPSWTSEQIKLAVTKAIEELEALDTDSLLKHRHDKFRGIGGFLEGGFIEPEMLRNMKKKDSDVSKPHRHDKFRGIGGLLEGEPEISRNMKKKDSDVSKPRAKTEVKLGNIKKKAREPEISRNMKKKDSDVSEPRAKTEVKLGNIKKKARDKKRQLPRSANLKKAVEKMRAEVDKETTKAFIAMGLKEKLEAINMEMSKSSAAPDQALNPLVKEKVDKLAQEFRQGLAQPGAFLGLKQKLKKLKKVIKMVKLKKGEKLKKEINDRLQGLMKTKMEILRRARDKVANGALLDEDEVKEIEAAKGELQEILRSANLEVVSVGTRRIPLAAQDLEDKVLKAETVTVKEIEKAVNKAGLREKIAELREEIRKGTNSERVEELEKEIREGIVAVLDAEELKSKIENQIVEPSLEASAAVEN